MAKKKRVAAERKAGRGVADLPVKALRSREGSRVVGGAEQVRTKKELNYYVITLE